MLRKLFKLMLVTQLFMIIVISQLNSQEEKIYSRDMLIQDARQLAKTIESAHPDPYIRGGGKIAFHRRLQDTLRSIPEEGMTKMEFYQLLLPLVAAIGDGHTRVFLSRSRQPSGPGLPLVFTIVEKYLYIAGVYEKAHEPLLGALLVSVEGISFEELVNRQAKLRGCDNEYHKLVYLSRFLMAKEGLESLLPEWKNEEKIQAVLKLNTGEEKECIFTIPQIKPENALTAKSKIKLPSTKKSDFVYDFLDSERRLLYCGLMA